MNFGTVTGIDLRLCAVLSVSLALGAGPALAQVKTDESSPTRSAAVNLLNHFAVDSSDLGPAPQPALASPELTPIAQVYPAPYSTTAEDLAPTTRDAAAIAQTEEADSEAETETEPTIAPAPIETRVLGSDTTWQSSWQAEGHGST